MTKIATLDLHLDVDPGLADPSEQAVTSDYKGEGVRAPDAVTDANGRTYQGYREGDTYFLPNDTAEQNRLDLQHKMCNLILDDRPGLAPIKSPRRVLDVATGTGIWAIEFAQSHPATTIIGTDLSQIQPKNSVPSNVSFVQHDAENEEWQFDEKFDYIHMRYVIACFDDTRKVMKKAFDNLQPGGWIEFLEFELDVNYFEDTPHIPELDEWLGMLHEGTARMGRSFLRAREYKGWLKEVGFVDVEDRIWQNPCNTWPKHPRLKEIGALQLRSVQEVLKGVNKLVGLTGLDAARSEELIHVLRQQMANTDHRITFPTHIVTGRKPE